MKKVILLVLLVGIAGIAGIVRSHSKSGGRFEWPVKVNAQKPSSGDVREEIRKTFELSPGARVDVSGINGFVKIETSNTRTADIYIERIGESAEALSRRKIIIESTGDKLTIRGEKDESLMSRISGSNAREQVTLKLPRAIALSTSGVNGSVKVGEIDGAVHISGINGRVEIAQAAGSADFSGINGNVSVALRNLGKDGIEISGINGNIELRLADGINADLKAHGMNGSVTSDLPSVVIEKSSRGNYTARIGSGGNSISASGINGNIRLIRMAGVDDRIG
ncbi:MAG TPA: hypothetical protein VEW46_12245 [Pyrinomonadaceae bacterium]|nr:hypothetical protein [Pyrinomonadaceae bacterium]